jgi:hypothetical protein
MDAKRWGQIKEIYDHALDLCDEGREDFLAGACAGDDELRREVESLLAAHANAGTFLQAPTIEVAAQEIVADEFTCASPKLRSACIFNKFIKLLAAHSGDVVRRLPRSRLPLPNPAAASLSV